MRSFVASMGAGLCGGSIAGAVEALMVLQSGVPSEYQALGYAWLLYGMFGLICGVLVGLPLALLRGQVGLATAWALTFCAVCSVVAGGTLVVGEATPGNLSLRVLAVAVLVALVAGVWLGGNVLEKTPLRILVGPRGWITAWLGGLVLAWVFALSPPPVPPSRAAVPVSTRRPLVVLVAVEAMRRDALPSGGAVAGDAPALAAFSADAIAFDQFVVASPSVAPSLASVFTGQSVSSHGFEGRMSMLDPELVTLAEVFSDAGLPVIGFPNALATGVARRFDQGFVRYQTSPPFPLGARASSAELTLFRVLWHAAPRFGWSVAAEAEPVVSAAEQARLTLQAVDEIGDQGGLIFVQISELREVFPSNDPVARLLRTPPIASVEAAVEIRQAYARAVNDVDAGIGSILAGLRQRGRYENATIFVVSLGGGGLYDHGRFAAGGDIFEEQIRVPLLVKLEAGRHAGRVVPWQVRAIDLAPTIAMIAGVNPSSSWEGSELFGDSFDADLAPVATEEEQLAQAPPWWMHAASRDALVQERWGKARLQGLRRRGKKLIQESMLSGQAGGAVRSSYFDLVLDQGERVDLFGQGADGEGEAKAALATMVEGRRRHLSRSAMDVEPAELIQLCAIGYFPKADCAGVAAEAASTR